MTPRDEVLDQVLGEMREVIVENLRAPPHLLLIIARAALARWADGGPSPEKNLSTALQTASLIARRLLALRRAARRPRTSLLRSGSDGCCSWCE